MHERHLAKNISASFARTRQSIRARLDLATNRRTENQRWRIAHGELIDGLIGPASPPDLREAVDLELQGIEVTYITLLLTTDQSVLVKDVHDEIGLALRRIRSSLRNLGSPDRDEAVRLTWGIPDGDPIPSSLAAFDDCHTIAQRAAVAVSMLHRFHNELTRVESYFNYKRGFTGPGKPTKYGMLYMVFALADLFERVGWQEERLTFQMELCQSAGEVKMGRSKWISRRSFFNSCGTLMKPNFCHSR